MSRFIVKALTYLITSFFITGMIISVCIKQRPDYFLGATVDYFICHFQYNQINKKTFYTNIIIGDSRGNASIKPKYLGNNWINLSIPGSDFLEGYITLKRHLARGNKLDTLIMVYGLNYISGHSNFSNIRTIPFRFISLNDLKDLELLEEKYSAEYQGSASVSTAQLKLYQLRRRLKYLHFPFSYNEGFLDGLHSLVYARKPMQVEINKIKSQLTENLGQLDFEINKSKDLNSLGKCNYQFNPNPVGLAYLDSILNLASKNNVKTFLVIPPINQAAFLYYKNSVYRRSVDRFFDTISINYPKLTIVKKPVSLPNTLFADSVHLNSNGSKAFTGLLKVELCGSKND